MIREANQKDAINLAALSIQVWLHSYATKGIRKEISQYVLKTFTEQYFEKLLKDPCYHILVFIQEDHLTGYIMVNHESFWQDKSNGYEIDTLYVQEHFQKKNIGRRLVSEIKIRYGASFWLSTWVHNEKAIGFYKHLGFIDIGHKYFELENESHENRVMAFKNTEHIPIDADCF